MKKRKKILDLVNQVLYQVLSYFMVRITNICDSNLLRFFKENKKKFEKKTKKKKTLGNLLTAFWRNEEVDLEVIEQ